MVPRPIPQPLAYKQIDAARALGISVRKFQTLKSKGLVRPANVDGMELYPAAELLRLLGQQQAAADDRPTE